MVCACLYCQIIGVVAKKFSNFLIGIFILTYVVVLFWTHSCFLELDGGKWGGLVFLRYPVFDTAYTSLTPLDLSELFNKCLAIRPSVASLGAAVLELTL